MTFGLFLGILQLFRVEPEGQSPFFETSKMDTSSNTGTRQCFESAYAHLDSTVRNFSREKLSYEDTIEQLRAELKQREAQIKEHSVRCQTLVSENENLLEIHDEDTTARRSMDAL
jgi:cell shape-determining protein MreC